MSPRALTTACVLVLLSRPLAAAVLFVEPTGADSNSGTRGLPLRSLTAAAGRAQGGDVVVVRPGVYRESVLLTRSGSAASPIVFRGLPGAVMESPDPTQSLSAFDVKPGVAHVAIEGFELRGGYAETIFVRPGAHDIELAGLHIHDNHTGIWVAGAQNVSVRDSIIDHNYRTGVRIFAGAQRVQVRDTRVEANDDGMGCQGDSDGVSADESTSDVLLERVSATGNSEDGLDLQTPTVTVLASVARANGCSGVKLAAGGYLENLVVERNTTGINISGQPGQLAVLCSCTLLDNALGVRAAGAGYGVQLVNSIVAGPGKAVSYAAAVQLTERYNVLYRPVAKDRLIVRVDGDDEVLYSGLDVNAGRWQRDSGQGTGSMYAKPGLTTGSCEPLAGSPAVDSGDATLLPALDLVGTLRPAGLGVDRGAIERLPAAATLRTRRTVARPDTDGMGRLSMYFEVFVATGTRFDARTDAVTVSVRGGRGEVVRVAAPAQGVPGARKVGVTAVRALVVNPSEPATRLRFVNDGTRVRLWFDARDVPLWTIDSGQIELTVTLGLLRATASVPVRYGR